MNENVLAYSSDDEISLIELLREAVADKLLDRRKPKGRRHEAALIVCMILLGILNQQLTIRAIGRYFVEHEADLAPLFGMYFDLSHGFASYSCLTRFLQVANPTDLSIILCQWSYYFVHDDGVTARLWGVDGQCAKSAKLIENGGRPPYNVDFFDIKSRILVFMTGVGLKSQEATVVADKIDEVIFMHPNVVICGDAMMTKLPIVDTVCESGCTALVPLKRNNPTLMKRACDLLVGLCLEGNENVEHFLDLNGEKDRVGCGVVFDAVCSYELEDNKNPDNPKSRPICEVKFFDNIYSYEKADIERLEDIKAKKIDGLELDGLEEASMAGLPTSADAKAKWFLVGDRYILMAPSHGRYERREYEVLKNPAEFGLWDGMPEALKEQWEAHADTIGLATRYRAHLISVGHGEERHTEWRLTITRTPYILTNSCESTENSLAEVFGGLVRSYWQVENNCHYISDNTYGQDASTCRVGHSTANMSLIRKTALNIVNAVRNEMEDADKKEHSCAEALSKLFGFGGRIVSILGGKPNQAVAAVV